MNSWARCLLHGRNKIYLSRNRYSNDSTQHTTLRDEDTQSEPSKRETFFNQQPSNHQAEVRSYVLYNDNTYLYRRLSLHPSTKHTSVIDTNPTLVTPTKEKPTHLYINHIWFVCRCPDADYQIRHAALSTSAETCTCLEQSDIDPLKLPYQREGEKLWASLSNGAEVE
jgi:hypothetical protein